MHTEGKLTIDTLTQQWYNIKADGVLIFHTPADPQYNGYSPEESEANAKRLIKVWNCHDELLTACKEIDHFFNESVGQILTSEQALQAYNNSGTNEKVKQAIAEAKDE